MAPIRSHSDDEGPRPDLAAHPSDQELVASYLRPRIETGKNPWKYVHDADVYGADPTDLTREYAPAVASDGSVAWYFFTAARIRTNYGKRRARTVGDGDGCWHSESGAKAIVDGLRRSRHLGRRQFFSFVKKEAGRRLRSGWIMVEIGLDGDKKEASSEQLVLCKVYRSPRVAPAAAPSSPDVKEETAAAAAPAPDAKKSKAAAAAAPVPAPDVAKATPATKPSKTVAMAAAAAAAAAAPTPGRKRKADCGKNSGAGRAIRLCTRCRVEPAESGSATTEEEEDGSRSERTETEVLEEDSETQSDDTHTANGGETVVVSSGTHPGGRDYTFYQFL